MDNYYDGEIDEKVEELEEELDEMKDVVKEHLRGKQKQAFNREIESPENLNEDRYITSEEVGKIVIDETSEQDMPEHQEISESNLDRNVEEGTGEDIEGDIAFEQLNSDGSYEEINDNELGNEHVESYDQSELVKEYEASSPSELEGILTPDAIDELKGSMDSVEIVEGLKSIGEVLEESIPEELVDDPGEDSEVDAGSDSGSGNII